MAGHVQIQEGPLVKEPLEIHIVDAEAGHAEHNGNPQSPNGLSVYSVTSPNTQAPVSASSDQRTPALRRRMSRLSRNSVLLGAEDSVLKFWDRFSRKGRKNIGVWESLRAIALSSCKLGGNMLRF